MPSSTAWSVLVFLIRLTLGTGDFPRGVLEGSIQLPGHELAISVELTTGATGPTGHISIPEQGAKDLPLEAIVIDGDHVTFRITGIPGEPTFNGTRGADGAIAGDFTQGGATFKFHLAAKGAGAADARKKLEGFGEVVDKARAALEVPGVAVAIVEDGEVVFSAGFGKRDVEKDLPVDEHTLFAIGSSSKAFTTFVLSTLVDQGKLEWDQPVHQWMPDLKLEDEVANERITPRDLVTHRSGLPRHDLMWYSDPTRTRADLVRRIRFLAPSKDFRTDFQYNNLMLLTAGVLIERVTGGTWEDAVRSRVLAPLGMTHTEFSVKESAADADHAEPYAIRDDKVVKIPFHDISQIGPAGSINSCVADMASWVRLHLSDGTIDGKKLSSTASLANLHAPVMALPAAPGDPDGARSVGYALGWFVDEYHGQRRVHHGGNIDGFSALVSLVPERRLGMVVLTNLDGNGLPELVVRLALDRLLPGDTGARDRIAEAAAKRAIAKNIEKDAKSKAATLRKAGTHPSHDLAEYVADYENAGYGVLSITGDGTALKARLGTLEFPLEHWHYDVFSATKNPEHPEVDGTKLLFRTDVDGEVDALEAALEPAVDPIVFKRLPDPKLKDPTYLARFVGGYVLGPMSVDVQLAGDALRITVSGQTSDLVPRRDDTFGVKELTGYSVKFTTDADGKVTKLEFRQPDGVFEAKRT